MPSAILTQIGVQAVMDLMDMKKSSSAYDSILKNMTKHTEGFSSTSNKSFRGVSDDLDNVASAAKRVSSIIYGILVADVFRAVGRSVGSMTSSIGEAVASFQMMKIQMDTIIARDYANAFGVSVTQALEESAGASKDLFEWITQLAVTTPFSTESLTRVVAMSQAYGFNIEESKRLAVATGDFTAAMGLSDEVMQRIIYNLGQMMAQGRPTGRELRDLSNSFVPLATIMDRFAEKLNVSRDAVREMFKTGEISSRDFTEEFIAMVEEDLPGAMERMSKTFATVKNNIQDLLHTIIGFRILGPIADEASADMQEFLETLLNEQTAKSADSLGQTLAFAYQRVAESISFLAVPAMKNFFATLGFGTPTTEDFSRIVLSMAAGVVVFTETLSQGIYAVTNFLNDLFEYFDTSFNDLVTSMGEWGKNVILAFAKGMSAAIQAVFQVLGAIAAAITGKLKGHSPPPILPDIDKWGYETMMIYLEGWKSADFGIFDDIGGLISDAVNSWRGQIEEEELFGRLIGSKEAVAQLVNEFRNLGEVSAESLNRVVDYTGIAESELKDFMKLSLELSELQGIDDAVKSALDFEGTGKIKVFDVWIDSFQDLIDISGQFGSDLASHIEQYASDSAKLLEVTASLTEAQTQLNETTAFYDELLASLNLQLNRVTDAQEDNSRIYEIDRTLQKVILTERERERLELEKRQILLQREIRDVQLEKKTKEDILRERINLLQTEEEVLRTKAETEKTYIESVSKANVDAIKDQIKVLEELIKIQLEINKLYRNTKETGGSGSGTEPGEENIPEYALTVPSFNVDEIIAALQDMWDAIIKDFRDFRDELLKPFEPLAKAWEYVVGEWKKVWESPEFQASWDTLVKTFEDIWLEIKTFWDQDGEKILTEIGTIIGNIVSHLFVSTEDDPSVLQLLAEILASVVSTIIDNKDELFEILVRVGEFIDQILFPEVKKILKQIAEEWIPKMVDGVLVMAPLLLDLLGYLVSNSDTLISIFTSMLALKALNTIAPGLLKLGLILLTISLTNLFDNIGFETARIARVIADWADETVETVIGWVESVGLWIGSVFKEDGIIDVAVTEASGIFSEWLMSIFGEDGTIMVGLRTFGTGFTDWLHGLFRKDGEVDESLKENTSINENFLSNLFGEEGVFATMLGIGNKLIDTQYTDIFGEGGIVDASLLGSFKIVSEHLDSVFGEEGLFATFIGIAERFIDTKFSRIFGFGGLIHAWYIISKARALIFLNEVFGENGMFATFIEDMKKRAEDSWAGKFVNAGKSLLDGLYQGLTDSTKRNAILQDIANFAQSLIDAMQAVFWERSPSKRTRLMAFNLLEGLRLGVIENASRPIDAVKSAMEGIVRTLESGLPTVSGGNTSSSIYNDHRVSVTVNPTYEKYSSPANIRNDVSAALVSARF